MEKAYIKIYKKVHIDKEGLHFRHNDYPPTDDADDLEIENNKLFRALIEFGSRIQKQITRRK